MVGPTIATKLIALGNEVMLGSRNPGKEKAVAWAQASGANASQSGHTTRSESDRFFFLKLAMTGEYLLKTKSRFLIKSC